MTEQLPGEQQQSENEQYEKLLIRLAGNEALKRFRARRKYKPGCELPLISPLEIVRQAKNPSAFQKEYDQQTADMKAILTIAAQFRRDGDEKAVEALFYSLTTGYPLPGEEDEISAVTRFTIIIPQAEKALALIDYMVNRFACDPNFEDPIHTDFPVFRKEYFSRNWHTPEIAKAVALKGSFESLYTDKILNLSEYIGRLDRKTREAHITPVVGLIYKAGVKELKSKLPRAEQEKAAFWTMEIPTYHWKYLLYKGELLHRAYLFPEREVNIFQKLGWISQMFQFGYGLWLGSNLDYTKSFEEFGWESIGHKAHAINAIELEPRISL